MRKLFKLGKRLGIECQNNEEDVISKLISLEERDANNSIGPKVKAVFMLVIVDKYFYYEVNFF